MTTPKTIIDIAATEADALRALLKTVEHQLSGETTPVKLRFGDLRAAIRVALEETNP